MAKGKSGRIVLEVDPALKRQLYMRLVSEGMTLKDWFIERAEAYLRTSQGRLPFGDVSNSASARTDRG
jgi:hypothetical protein